VNEFVLKKLLNKVLIRDKTSCSHVLKRSLERPFMLVCGARFHTWTHWCSGSCSTKRQLRTRHVCLHTTKFTQWTVLAFSLCKTVLRSRSRKSQDQQPRHQETMSCCRHHPAGRTQTTKRPNQTKPPRPNQTTHPTAPNNDRTNAPDQTT
jgi:hypothetical protein